MDTTLVTGLAATPVITGLIEIVKPFLPDKRWYPPVAIVLGVGWNIAVSVQAMADVRPAVLVGVVVGLAASGLYSAAGSLRGDN